MQITNKHFKQGMFKIPNHHINISRGHTERSLHARWGDCCATSEEVPQ